MIINDECAVYKSACGLVKKQFPALSENRLRSIAQKVARWASEAGPSDCLVHPSMGEQVARLPSKLAALFDQNPQLFSNTRGR